MSGKSAISVLLCAERVVFFEPYRRANTERHTAENGPNDYPCASARRQASANSFTP
jgi:hypothetical protein